MQKQTKNYIIFAILVFLLIAPSFALAAWWNPFSWGIWNRVFHFQRTEQKQEQQDKQTADWKTYANNKYGFEVKYPKNFNLKEIPIKNDYVASDYAGAAISLPQGTASVFAYDSANPMMNIASLADCVFTSSDLQKKYGLSYIGQKDINGITAYYYRNFPEYLGGYCGMSGGCQYHDIYRILNNGNCYEIDYQRSDKLLGKNAAQVPDIFNQIVSTFKFIDDVGQVGKCQTQSDCPTIYCIKTPCPQNKCINNTCMPVILLDDVYPLFSDGNLNWGSAVEKITQIPVKNTSIKGYEIKAEGTISQNIDARNFMNYYDAKLKTSGWVVENNFAADGIKGSQRGYKKGNDYIVLSHDITPGKITSGENEPLQWECPCGIVYTIMSGGVIKK